MARPGQIIENPVTGERVVFRETGAATTGERLEFAMFVEPQGFVAAEHLHPSQTESFQVQRVELHLIESGEEKVYRSGDSTSIPQALRMCGGTAGTASCTMSSNFSGPTVSVTF